MQDAAGSLYPVQDSEAEGYRAPMRTGYVDRLIDTPQAAAASRHHQSKLDCVFEGCVQDLSWAWAMLQGQGWIMRSPLFFMSLLP